MSIEDKEKDEMLKKISKMPLSEIMTLTKGLMEEIGVTDEMLAPVQAVQGQGAAAPAAVEEKTEFTLVLSGVKDPKDKIPVIKVVREVTGLGIKEAKELVESAPKAVIKEGVSKADAEALIDKFKSAGGICEMK